MPVLAAAVLMAMRTHAAPMLTVGLASGLVVSWAVRVPRRRMLCQAIASGALLAVVVVATAASGQVAWPALAAGQVAGALAGLWLHLPQQPHVAPPRPAHAAAPRAALPARARERGAAERSWADAMASDCQRARVIVCTS